MDTSGLPASVKLYTDEDESSSWSKIGDNILHIRFASVIWLIFLIGHLHLVGVWLGDD